MNQTPCSKTGAPQKLLSAASSGLVVASTVLSVKVKGSGSVMTTAPPTSSLGGGAPHAGPAVATVLITSAVTTPHVSSSRLFAIGPPPALASRNRTDPSVNGPPAPLTRLQPASSSRGDVFPPSALFHQHLARVGHPDTAGREGAAGWQLAASAARNASSSIRRACATATSPEARCSLVRSRIGPMLVWTTTSSSSRVLAEAGGMPGIHEVAVLTPAVGAVAPQRGEVGGVGLEAGCRAAHLLGRLHRRVAKYP